MTTRPQLTLMWQDLVSCWGKLELEGLAIFTGRVLPPLWRKYDEEGERIVPAVRGGPTSPACPVSLRLSRSPPRPS